MKEIIVPEYHAQFFNEDTETFSYVNIEETTLHLEHSLISLQKWEQKWHKPFLNREDKTEEEIFDYIRCMTLTSKKINPDVYRYLSNDIINEVIEYIKDPMSATTFNDSLIGAQKNSREIVTAEIIYYWMVTYNIPVEFQKWHLNQLLTLIKVVSIKNAPKKKMNQREAAQQRAALNKARRAKYNSKG